MAATGTEAGFPLTRRALIAGAAAAVLLPPAAHADEGSVAGLIGREIGKGALGRVGGLGLDTMLRFAGVDYDGAAATLAKLDQILSKLDALQTTVDTMRGEMLRAVSQLSYDVAAAPVIRLIDRNATLGARYRTLLTLSGAELAAAKEDIARDSLMLESAIENWDNALLGKSGQTGLIQAWGRDVLNSSPNLYGGKQAQQTQARWDYLDAQQALSVTFLVNALVARGEPNVAAERRARWQANRAAQKNALRGPQRYSDDSWDGAPRIYLDRIAPDLYYPNHLPRGVVIWIPRQIMWAWAFTDPFAQGDSWANFQGAVPLRARDALARAGAPLVRRAQEPWRTELDTNQFEVFDPDTYVDFLRVLGAHIGESGADYFTGALRNSGIAVTSDRLWTNDNRWKFVDNWPSGDMLLSAFVEGNSWDHPAEDPRTVGALLLGRRLRPGEAERYWWTNA